VPLLSLLCRRPVVSKARVQFREIPRGIYVGQIRKRAGISPGAWRKPYFFTTFFGNITYIDWPASEARPGDEPPEIWHSYMQDLVIGKVANRTTGKKISGVKLLAHFFHVVCLGGGGREDEKEEEENHKELAFRNSKLESVTEQMCWKFSAWLYF